MVDHYAAGAHEKRSSPGRDAVPVTPHNDTVLNPVPKALRVFNSADAVKQITFRTPGGGSTGRVWKLSPGQTIIPVTVTRVMASGTDAGDLTIHAITD